MFIFLVNTITFYKTVFLAKIVLIYPSAFGTFLIWLNASAINNQFLGSYKSEIGFQENRVALPSPFIIVNINDPGVVFQ